MVSVIMEQRYAQSFPEEVTTAMDFFKMSRNKQDKRDRRDIPSKGKSTSKVLELRRCTWNMREGGMGRGRPKVGRNQALQGLGCTLYPHPSPTSQVKEFGHHPAEAGIAVSFYTSDNPDSWFGQITVVTSVKAVICKVTFSR